MAMSLQVYTANEKFPEAPKEAVKRYFIPLGVKHNYGCCYEFVCWLKDSHTEVDSPYLSLIYSSEMKMCKPCGIIDIRDAISQLKVAIKLFPSTMVQHDLHRTYMLNSARLCLDQLLFQYSFDRYHWHMASRIQTVWRYHFETPTSPICYRIKMRQFEEMNNELYDFLNNRNI